MRKFATSAALSVALSLTGLAPSFAAPLSAPVAPQVSSQSDVQNVQYRRHRGERRGFYRAGRDRFYNGYRGYRSRPGRHYRRHNDFWFPLAAFALGAAIATPRYSYREPRVIYRTQRAGLPRAHYRWCYDRYRSYRASDNTFQPYHGPRRACYSPYD